MSEFGGRNAALARTYGMPAEELAALMLQWRAMAMTWMLIDGGVPA